MSWAVLVLILMALTAIAMSLRINLSLQSCRRQLLERQRNDYDAFIFGRLVTLEQVESTLSRGQTIDSVRMAVPTPDEVLEYRAAQHFGVRYVPFCQAWWQSSINHGDRALTSRSTDNNLFLEDQGGQAIVEPAVRH